MVRVEEARKHQKELIQQLIQPMDKRFEQIDLWFKMFEKRFEQIDKRFEQVEKRSEQIDQRFFKLQRRIDRFMFWSVGMTLTVGRIIVAILKFLSFSTAATLIPQIFPKLG